MANEPVDGYLLLALLDVYAQQMGGPGFVVRDDTMRQIWQRSLGQPGHIGNFLEQLCERIIAVRSRWQILLGDPQVPIVDVDQGLVTYQIAGKTIRVNLKQVRLELVSGKLEEVPAYIGVYIQPAHE